MKQAIASGRKLITILSVLSILIVSVFSVFVGAPFTAVAETPLDVDVWAGYTDNSYNATFQGSGTPTDPYLIENGDQLWKMVKSYGIIGGGYAKYDDTTGKFLNGSDIEVFPAHYKLTKDIYLNDISDYDNWKNDTTGLNNWHAGDLSGVSFFGHFDGDGHTVYGLYVSSNRAAAFLPAVGRYATVKNVHFRNAYVVNTLDFTGDWASLSYGGAAVIAGYCPGSRNDTSAQFTISNCSVMDCYVEGEGYTAGMVARFDDCVPSIKNSIAANNELNSTVANVEGGIFNDIYGSEKVATMEGLISIGYPIYGVGDPTGWNGHKIPIAAFKYVFKDCYSDVKHVFSVEKNGETLNFPNPDKPQYPDEVNYIKPSKFTGEQVKELLDLDWEHNWRTTDGYPLPNNEYIVPTGDKYYENGGPKASSDMWNGKAANDFAAGTGTVEDPYLIETCEQFYKMVSTLNAGDYYKVADGVEALYFNDVKDFTYEQTYDYLSQSKRAHIYNPGQNNFGGYFDGNGVTIYGVKAESELIAGLFPKVNSCTVKNFTVKNSYFYAPDDNNSNTVVEGASAVIGDLNSNAAVNMRNIAVIDCYVNSPTFAAGLVACSHTGGAIFVDDCIVSGGKILADDGTNGTAAFVARSNSGTHVIKNAIALGVYPAADNAQSYGSKFTNVYTDFDAPSSLVAEAVGETALGEGNKVIKVPTEALMSKAAMETAIEFDWDTTWKTMRYEPMPLVHKAVFGAAGEPWSGEVSDAYAGGTGTQGNPYQIDTPERLAQMILYCQPGAYYELTADININDTSADNWQENAIEWFTSADVDAFKGVFNGRGKTIRGLYYGGVASGEYAGLIPVIGSGGQVRNLFIEDSAINVGAGATAGTIIGNVADGATNVVTLRACYVGDTVTLAGAGNIAGVVGRVGLTKLKFDNTLCSADMTGATGNKSGLAGEVVGKLEIKESVSAGTYPFFAKEGVTATSIYTDTDSTLAVDGVILLENANMLGENAKTYMTALDFDSENATWTVIEADYPHPTGNSKPFDGVQGEAWTGEVATKFAGGTGTPDDPYQIATGEQLALMISKTDSNNKIKDSYKLISDIYLNDVYDPLWKDLVGCTSWYSNYESSGVFTGIFDGDGYGVFGMYYNNPSAPASTFVALFPRIADSAVIKNVAISHAYIDANVNEGDAYAGGIFANCGTLGSYNLYSLKAMPADTVGDEYKGVPLPKIENCIVDQHSIIKSGNAGGIGCPGGGVVVIRDCVVTATIQGYNESRAGALIGNQWSGGSRIYNSLAFTQNDVKSSAGVHQWIEDEAGIYYYHENAYYYGSVYIFGTTNVPRPQWRVGDEAKTAMPNLDWENNWRTVAKSSIDGLPGTPIPRIFDKDSRSGDIFSDTTFNIPDVQINFITGDPEITVPSIVGKPYEPVSLPTVSRTGYLFTGWYSFPDITLEYPYEYFLSRDINLYAGWKKNGIIQDFEDYPYSMYDCDLDRWNYNKPGSRGGYNFDYVRGGTKSMQLLNNSAESADLLVNYEEWLTVGQNYQITFWIATDKADTAATLSLVQNNHPDYIGTEVASEPMVTVTGQKVGEWKQYSFSFTAQTRWVSLRATGNSSLFIDDIVIAPVGEIVNNNTIVGDLNVSSPNTSDAMTVAAIITTIVACAIIFVISKKSFVEVIEKN